MSRAERPKGWCGFPKRLSNSPITRGRRHVSDFSLGVWVVLGLVAVFAALVAKVNLDRKGEDLRLKQHSDQVQRLLEIGFDILARHEPVLKIRLQQVMYKDPYGNWVTKAAYREIHYFVKNVLFREAPELEVAAELDTRFTTKFSPADYWVANFSPLILDFANELDAGLVPASVRTVNTGVQYERMVAGKLAALGFSVEFTPRTGDQGVDVLAVRGCQRLAVQCKDYQGSVGNDAIQQAYAGAGFHQMSEAIVVSSGKYTPAALTAGQRLGVKCLHHDELEHHFTVPHAG